MNADNRDLSITIDGSTIRNHNGYVRAGLMSILNLKALTIKNSDLSEFYSPLE